MACPSVSRPRGMAQQQPKEALCEARAAVSWVLGSQIAFPAFIHLSQQILLSSPS